MNILWSFIEFSCMFFFIILFFDKFDQLAGQSLQFNRSEDDILHRLSSSRLRHPFLPHPPHLLELLPGNQRRP
jgi:hypothetical protein